MDNTEKPKVVKGKTGKPIKLSGSKGGKTLVLTPPTNLSDNSDTKQSDVPETPTLPAEIITPFSITSVKAGIIQLNSGNIPCVCPYRPQLRVSKNGGNVMEINEGCNTRCPHLQFDFSVYNDNKHCLVSTCLKNFPAEIKLPDVINETVPPPAREKNEL